MQTQDRWQWQDSSNQVHQAGNLSIRNRASFRMVRNLSPFFGRLIGDPLARVPVRQGHQRSTPVIPDAENASPPIPVQLVSKHLLASWREWKFRTIGGAEVHIALSDFC